MIDTKAIRCGVIRLALSGMLSKHEASDGSVDELLARVKPGADIRQTNSIPYSLPEHWAWVKLSDLYEINPKVEAHPDTEAAFVPMERVSAGFDDSFTFDITSWSLASKNHTKFADGDVAFAKISPCFENRKSFIAQGLPNGIGGGTTELIVLRQREMLPQYTHYLVLDQRLIKAGVASYSGMVGQQRVKPDVIRNYMVPVPPLPEQHRIVAKLDAIFSLLDTIDALQSAYTANQKALRAKLIDAAIRGQLTEQLPEDGTAEELYQQIQAEKAALIAAGKIKREKPLPEIKADEVPFEVPGNWMWVRFTEVTDMLAGYAFKSEEFKASGRYRLLRGINLGVNEIRWNDTVYVDDMSAQLENYRIAQEDVLFGMDRPWISSGTRVCIYNGNMETYLVQRVLRLRGIKGVHNKYIHLLLTSKLPVQEIGDKTTGISVPHVSEKQVGSIPIPLPPLAEQRRIVARLEELLAVCG